MTERVAFVVKGYPRLSETFIAQEIRGLEAAGLPIEIWSLRRPTDRAVHPVHREIAAPVRYLPEYLWREPRRVWRALAALRRDPRFRPALKAWLADLRRDPTPNRVRRFGQALVLAHELPPSVARLHAHFLHTPASVTRYAAMLTGRPWTGSAHAKDVWTTPGWEIAEKLAGCDWLVTCSAAAQAHLAAHSPDPDKVELVYHGLDLARFAPRPGLRPHRDGSRADDPVVVLAVGRAVEKKGFDTLIDALGSLPPGLHWRLVHIGGGRDRRRLARRAAAAGVADKVTWLGARAQDDVLAWYRKADLFVLPSKVARDGDRDGLPNVLMEAASQGLACISTRVSAIPELVQDGATGVLVPPGDTAALAAALAGLIAAPDRRLFMGRAAERRVRTQFSSAAGIARLADRFGVRAAAQAASPAA